MIYRGTLIRDPELRYTTTGKSVCNILIIAPITNKEHRVVAWEDLAKYINENFSQGDIIGFDGYPKTRKWKDRDGNTRSTIEVTVRRLVD